MTVDEANAVAKRIDQVMREYLGDRVMREGAEPIYKAIFRSIETLARAGEPTVFGPRHKALIDRFSEPPQWRSADAKLEEVGRERKQIARIVSKSLELL